MIDIKDKDGNKRTVVEEADVPVAVRHYDKKRVVYVMKAKIGGVMRTVWEQVRGFIFTSDDYCEMTSDEYYPKCNDQD